MAAPKNPDKRVRLTLTVAEIEGLQVFTTQTWNADPETDRAIKSAYEKLYSALCRAGERP